MANNKNLTTEQAISHRFGQPNGNPRNPGGWKKEDTARYKLEQMMKLSESQLRAIEDDSDAPMFERKIAKYYERAANRVCHTYEEIIRLNKKGGKNGEQ